MQNTYHTSIGAVNTLVQRYNEISEETIKAWRTFLCSLPGVKGEVVDEVLEQAKSLLIEASNLFCSLLSSTTNEQIINDDCKKGPLGLIFNHLNSLGGLTDVDLLVIDNELNDKLEPEIVEEIMIILHMLHIDESSSGKLQGMVNKTTIPLYIRIKLLSEILNKTNSLYCSMTF